MPYQQAQPRPTCRRRNLANSYTRQHANGFKIALKWGNKIHPPQLATACTKSAIGPKKRDGLPSKVRITLARAKYALVWGPKQVTATQQQFWLQAGG